MSLTPLAFSGLSSFSSDFQTLLSRAVSIASLPIKALQNEQTDVVQRKMVVTGLRTAVEALASQLSGLGEIGEQRALAAASSDPAKVRATNVSAASAAAYQVSEIRSVARVASETSISGYENSTSVPVSGGGTLRLVANGRSYDLDLAGENHLVGLRDAINRAGAGVTATIFTTGTGEKPNYLSITANAPGATELRLVDDPAGSATELMTANNQGANTEFKLNGVEVSKASTLINDVIPGVTLEILGRTEGSAAVVVTLGTDRTRISSALAGFAHAYNNLVDQLQLQFGESAGLLGGDFLVREIQQTMRRLTGYAGSGPVKSLAELGLELGHDGRMSFDHGVFDALSDSRVLGALDLLGSSTAGLGGLARQFTAISDPVTGLAKLQLDRYDATDLRIRKQIEELTGRISLMQAGLLARLQAADAVLGQLESQKTMVQSSVQSLNFVLYGRKEA